MPDIKFCNRCVYSNNHPLGLIINDDGLCTGCKIHEEKDTLDWLERWDKLLKLVQEYRSIDGKNYDCIVPVSGANDSYFIVYLVKERLGLNPLLVTYNKYWNTAHGIRNLANLRIKFDCDILIQNVNPISVKKITKNTLRNFGSIYWHVHAGQTAFPVQTAIRYKIPLIIWGAHQGIEQTGMYSYRHEVEMSRRYRKDHDLLGIEADDLLSIFGTLKEKDIWQYRYPDDHDINEIGVRGIYLNNYVRWDPKSQHEEMIKKYGYITKKFNRTFDCYDHVDCFNYMELHDLLKLYKHGYSKVTDHVSREIRFSRLTRDEGIMLIEKYEQSDIQYQSQFCSWLGMKEKGINFILDRHRNLKYWDQDEQNHWKFNGLSKMLRSKKQIMKKNKEIKYIHDANLSDKYNNDNYIIIGKGYP